MRLDMKIIKLLIVLMVSLQSTMMVNCSDQALTPAQKRQDIIDYAMRPENYTDLKQDLAFLESQHLLKPHSFLNLLNENVTESQDANFDETIERAQDLITERMKDPFISTLQRALEENKPFDQYINSVDNPLFTYIMQRKDNDIALQNTVYSWLLKWSAKKDKNGMTPLHIAAGQGYTEILQLLLAAGANVNSPTTRDGATPLHSAA